MLFFFFFQAEDGIRDADVTGVQTCALPISPGAGHRRRHARRGAAPRGRPPRLPGRAAMTTPVLAVEEVYTSYGLSQVLFGVSLEVAAGECVCLLGRNGVGKTTTMRSIMGLTPPRQGRVIWKGKD